MSKQQSYAQELTERFWSRVDTSGGPDACWEWQGKFNTSGYGNMIVRRLDFPKLIGAHRIALFLATGEILSSNQVVMHACNNKACCNPVHLSAGSHYENLMYAIKCGARPGNRTPRKRDPA